jgi:hypothetical protein
MDMGVVEQLLRPGVQDGEHADGRSDMASVASELDYGLGGGLHQEGVAVTPGESHLEFGGDIGWVLRFG